MAIRENYNQGTRRINDLKPEERMNHEWEYVLISEDSFYGLSANGVWERPLFEKVL